MHTYTVDQRLSILEAITKWERGAFEAKCPVCSNQIDMNDGQHGYKKAHPCSNCPIADRAGSYGCGNTPFLDDEPSSERGVAYLRAVLNGMQVDQSL